MIDLIIHFFTRTPFRVVGPLPFQLDPLVALSSRAGAAILDLVGSSLKRSRRHSLARLQPSTTVELQSAEPIFDHTCNLGSPLHLYLQSIVLVISFCQFRRRPARPSQTPQPCGLPCELLRDVQNSLSIDSTKLPPPFQTTQILLDFTQSAWFLLTRAARCDNFNVGSHSHTFACWLIVLHSLD
jgi:hypothetical protein